jgi:serine/threonine-protein kinase
MSRVFERVRVQEPSESAGLDEASSVLGRYELLFPVGRGGMGVVWAARLRGTRGFTRVVAVKVLRAELSCEPRFERMFLAEAEIASRIRHPNVCRILDLGEDRGVLYLVMELVDGDSLATLLRIARSLGRTVPYASAAWIAARAARGLEAAHELVDDHGTPYPVVHRDVSPQNIMATPEGLVQIADFGIAKAAFGSTDLTRSGYIKGKVAYFSPEQVRGERVDARTDVFALGTVLYELSTGEHPFRGDNDLSTILRIGADHGAPPPKAADYPSDLRAIVEKALEKDVDRRYATMREFADDLERFANAAGHTAADAEGFLATVLGDRQQARAARLREAIRRSERGDSPRSGWASQEALHEAPTAPGDGDSVAHTVPRTDARQPARARAWLELVGVVLAGALGAVALAYPSSTPRHDRASAPSRSDLVAEGVGPPTASAERPGSSPALEPMPAATDSPPAQSPPVVASPATSSPVGASQLRFPRRAPETRAAPRPEPEGSPASVDAAVLPPPSDPPKDLTRFRDPGF